MEDVTQTLSPVGDQGTFEPARTPNEEAGALRECWEDGRGHGFRGSRSCERRNTLTTPSLFASCRETRRFPLPPSTGDGFSSPEAAGLWNAFLEDRSTAHRNALVQHYYPLARRQASQFRKRCTARFDPDDVLCAAGEGLLAAVMTYEPAFQTRFETYAAHRIRGAILDWWRSEDAQPRMLRCFERRRRSAWTQISCEQGRPAQDEELAARLGLTRLEFARLSARKLARERISMDQRGHGELAGSEEERPRWDVAHPVDHAPSESVERQWVREFLCRGLSAIERQVLVLYYYEDMTMAEIGRVLGRSESRVCQLHRQVLEALKLRLRQSHNRQAV
ncbi:MAG: sigma-70 family RNA polymerase sigma factor [Planctomycetota bacterium]|nr:MAG: sigma-70 family RNA polymerase sigma factor [Planctomycetota bacterium]KAB2949575.1 MAG: sigma-70 family RNA polymerase sigma factor [Phycisphaerae bacterium]